MPEARIEISLDEGDTYRIAIRAPSPRTGQMVRIGLPCCWGPADYISAMASAGRYGRATGLPVVDLSA